MQKPNEPAGIDRLIGIMKRLRSPCGCPWDRKQTPESLKSSILEEAYELLEAIDSSRGDDICDEAGDLLLQIVFLSQIFSERNTFDFDDVAENIADKMVRRHPHVFGRESKEDHMIHWEEIKRQERQRKGKAETLKNHIPVNLPALKTCTKIIKNHEELKLNDIYSELTASAANLCNPNNNQHYSDQLPQLITKIIYSTVKLATINNLDIEDLIRQANNDKIAIIDNQSEG